MNNILFESYFLLIDETKQFSTHRTQGIEWQYSCIGCTDEIKFTALLLIAYSLLTFWRRNYFFNFSTSCI